MRTPRMRSKRIACMRKVGTQTAREIARERGEREREERALESGENARMLPLTIADSQERERGGASSEEEEEGWR